MKKQNCVNQFEVIFENSDILSNPFMDYTKAELEESFSQHQEVYTKSQVGSAPRRQAFTAMAHVEVAFDAYAKGIKQFNLYVDDQTTLRDIIEESYEASHGELVTVEDMRKLASPSPIADTLVKTKDVSKKAGESFLDGIFHATSWLSTKTNPSNRK